MSGRPLVSVITPTWERPELLSETVENVHQQSYPHVEHIIVSDGPDAEVQAVVNRFLDRTWRTTAQEPRTRVVELGRNWSGDLPGSFGIAPLVVGMLMARGAYQMWLCDDERMIVPDHIAALVDLLESSRADFVYPKVRMWMAGSSPEAGWDIGTDPPAYGQITHFLYRAGLLKRAMPAFGTHPLDWSLVRAWMDAGASWAMLDRVTLSHRADR